MPAIVAAACEILGLDPLHVANEGCLVAIVDPDVVDAVVAAMRTTPEGSSACVIGSVIDASTARVVMSTIVGSRRIVDMLIGEQLPRIC